MRRNRNRKSSIHRERIIMVASSLLVMSALTATGIFLKQRNAGSEEQNYSLDFGLLEDQDDGDGVAGVDSGNSGNNSNLAAIQEEKLSANTAADGITFAESNLDEVELDYSPASEVGSSLVEIPGLTDQDTEGSGSTSEGGNAGKEADSLKESQTSGSGQTGSNGEDGETTSDGEDVETGTGAETGTGGTVEETSGIASSLQLSFSPESGLTLPVSGEILMHYSMDGSIYFATLDQYKYNSAVYFSAWEGEEVLACADALVLSVFEDEELGLAVTLDLGNGYQATYGQLSMLTVSEGEEIGRGEVLGYVASPTKYYSVEGTNLYFQLTLDGSAVDPEELFQQ